MTSTPKKFDFGEDFQSQIAALLLRDPSFHRRTDGSIKPSYFQNEIEGCIASVWIGYFHKYKTTPQTGAAVKQLIVEAFKHNQVPKTMRDEFPKVVKKLLKLTVPDKKFVVDSVIEFIRHQEMTMAILKSVDLIEKGEYGKVEAAVKAALNVGIDAKETGHDFWKEIETRKEVRKAMLSGAIKPSGITTGLKVLDNLLRNKGWGRAELSVIMGGAKAGKTTMLLDSARAASLAGYNVLTFSLEVSAEIVAERMEANMSEIPYAEMNVRADEIAHKLDSLKAKAGMLEIHEMPTGSLTPTGIERVIEHYASLGVEFDLVVVDYADLMSPNYRYDSAIENSKSVYIDLRAIAQRYNLAMLTATQTNRAGMGEGVAVAKMEHVAEDINKVRICDLMISINVTEEEWTRGEARLFLAASRNQRGNITIHLKTALERGKFYAKVISFDA